MLFLSRAAACGCEDPLDDCGGNSGQCSCPPLVTGRTCDACLQNTFGDPSVGCEVNNYLKSDSTVLVTYYLAFVLHPHSHAAAISLALKCVATLLENACTCASATCRESV